MKRNKTALMCATALLAALCYIGFQFLRIDIPIGVSKTAIHFGNTFCVLAALLIGGPAGGAAGAIGMGIADLTGGYATSAPKTIIMKLMIGVIAGLIAHKLGHIDEHTNDKKYMLKWAILASSGAMLFNIILDPIFSYFYKNFLLGIPSDAALIMTAWSTGSTFINAITTIICASLLYIYIAPLIKNLRFLKK